MLEVRVEEAEAELCRRSLTVTGLPLWRQKWEEDMTPNAPDEDKVENAVWSLIQMINPRAPECIEEIRLVFGKWSANKSIPPGKISIAKSAETGRFARPKTPTACMYWASGSS